MPLFQTSILKEADIDNLLELQRSNLKQNLDSESIESQGFVSFVYDNAIMKRMVDDAPQIIIKDNNEVIAYALTTTVEVGNTMTLMKPLIDIIEKVEYNGIPLSRMHYYIMGQVCVKKGYRGLGLFDLLYQGHKEHLASQYDCIVTEIADDNKRSLAAHRRVGFKTVHEYFDEISNKHWHIVLWDWK